MIDAQRIGVIRDGAVIVTFVIIRKATDSICEGIIRIDAQRLRAVGDSRIIFCL